MCRYHHDYSSSYATTGAAAAHQSGCFLDTPRIGRHASYNIAKIPLDFTVSIARGDLKGRYSEGFGGAPLHIPSSSPRTVIGDGYGRHEQQATQSSTSTGGDDHV